MNNNKERKLCGKNAAFAYLISVIAYSLVFWVYSLAVEIIKDSAVHLSLVVHFSLVLAIVQDA